MKTINPTKVVNFARNLRHTKRLRASWTLAMLQKVPWEIIDIRGGDLFLSKHPDLPLNHPDRFFILQALPLIDQLIRDEGLEVLRVGEKHMDVVVRGVKFTLETREDVYIVHEVFHCADYDIRLGTGYRVIDVGANIGVATLYFSSRPDVISVDSFELVPETAKRFKANLRANPDLTGKVTLHEFGLAAEDRELEIDYYPDLKGSMGIAGIAERAPQLVLQGRAKSRISVEVRNAAQVLESLIESHAEVPVVMKVDCEGAEYEIIDCLASCGLLERIAATVIEWHGRGAAPLRSRLEEASHFVVLKSDASLHHGIMVSVNRQVVSTAGEIL